MINQKLAAEEEGIISHNKYVPGDLISTDQFVMGIPDKLESRYGHEAKNISTIYNDAGSGVTWVENQVLLGSGKTFLGKQMLEEWLWE